MAKKYRKADMIELRPHGANIGFITITAADDPTNPTPEETILSWGGTIREILVRVSKGHVDVRVTQESEGERHTTRFTHNGPYTIRWA